MKPKGACPMKINVSRAVSFLAVIAVIFSISCVSLSAQTFSSPGTDTPDFFREGLPRSDEKQILFGTPVVDGKLDEAYLSSYCVYLAPGTEGYPDDREPMEKTARTEGVAFLLYDESWLYVCCVVRDKTLCSMSQEWWNKSNWPWNNDGAEIFVYLGDRIERSVHIAAYGLGAKEHYKRGVQDRYSIKDSSEWGSYIIGEDLYSVEVAFPLKNGETAGSKVGVQLEIDDRWSTEDEGAARGIFHSHSPSENLVVLAERRPDPTQPSTSPATDRAKPSADGGNSVIFIAVAVVAVIAVGAVAFTQRKVSGK